MDRRGCECAFGSDRACQDKRHWCVIQRPSGLGGEEKGACWDVHVSVTANISTWIGGGVTHGDDTAKRVYKMESPGRERGWGVVAR